MNDINLKTVKRKIRSVFPDQDENIIYTQLCAYGVESHEQEKYRVYLAILKLCEEEGLSDPSHYISEAKQDFRDVLYWAEYPNEVKSPTNAEKDPKKIAKITKKDKEQYINWLNKN